jgi:hypothetical protein
MAVLAIATRSIVRAFGEVLADHWAERARLDSDPQKRATGEANLVRRLRDAAAERVAAIDKHVAASTAAVAAASPAARRREALVRDPARVLAVRQLLEDAPEREVVAFAEEAVANTDYSISAALAGLRRELDGETLAAVGRAVRMTTSEFDAAFAQLAVVKAERARLQAAVSFADPSGRSVLDVQNEASEIELDGARRVLDEATVARCYEAVGLDRHLALPTAPEAVAP